MGRRWRALGMVALGVGMMTAAWGKAAPTGEWRFVISGDSRDCGDVVMPAIAAQVVPMHPAFYWHLGDFRHITDFDPDMTHDSQHRSPALTVQTYEADCWPDFIQQQLVPFGSVPVYLAIGNHETSAPKTREQYLLQFADWIDAPVLRAQRLRDDPTRHMLQSWFHWVTSGVDCISLDNATPDQFDKEQLRWLEDLLKRDAADPSIRTIVVGMHEALPDSVAENHSMATTPVGRESGRRVYADLLRIQNDAHRHVYVFASHSHYYMEDIFDTDYWRLHGGVLPGWIVGTAGAIRFPLPERPPTQKGLALAHTYGYLTCVIRADGTLQAEFHALHESDVPAGVVQRYGADFVHWAFTENVTTTPLP